MMSENLAQILSFAALLLLAGAFSGLVAGLLGIGGGLVMVPILFHALKALGYEGAAIHTAIATSLTVIVTTSIRSTLAHHQKGAVDTDVLRHWLVWLFPGALAGALAAGRLSDSVLTGIFGGAALLISLLFFRRDRDNKPLTDRLPGGISRAAIGSGIGALSALMGIGGGVFGVPLMTVCGMSIHRAVGTSAAFGAAIGFPGMIGYLISGWGQAGRPPLSAGYVHGPGWLVMAGGAILLAPVGARLAHQIEARLLRRIFGIALAVNGAHMLYKALG